MLKSKAMFALQQDTSGVFVEEGGQHTQQHVSYV